MLYDPFLKPLRAIYDFESLLKLWLTVDLVKDKKYKSQKSLLKEHEKEKIKTMLKNVLEVKKNI